MRGLFLNNTFLKYLLLFSFSFYCSAAWSNFSLTPSIGDPNRSRAGGAAAAEDATTVYTNPAGLTRLTGQQFNGSAQYFMTSTTFTNNDSKDALGTALNGDAQSDGNVKTFVPAFYYSNKVSEQISIGLAINGAFGLSTDYPRNWVGRYSAITTSIMAMNINPSAAFKFNHEWSAGFGINAQQAQATLSRAIDFGAVCLANLNPATCSTLGMPAPQSADGYVELKGDDWGAGYNFGLLWTSKHTAGAGDTRVGLAYRSKVSYQLKGDATFSIPAAATVFNPTFTNTGVTIPLTLPDILSLSIYHNVNNKLAVMADITRTRWSRFQQLEFHFDNPAQPEQILQKHWRDTNRYAVGIDYRYDRHWRWQGGIAYERSPIPDDTYDPSVPVGNTTWVSAGMQYSLSDKHTFEFGWTHVTTQSRQVHLTGSFGETLQGSTDTKLDVLNARLIWAF